MHQWLCLLSSSVTLSLGAAHFLPFDLFVKSGCGHDSHDVAERFALVLLGVQTGVLAIVDQSSESLLALRMTAALLAVVAVCTAVAGSGVPQPTRACPCLLGTAAAVLLCGTVL